MITTIFNVLTVALWGQVSSREQEWLPAVLKLHPPCLARLFRRQFLTFQPRTKSVFSRAPLSLSLQPLVRCASASSALYDDAAVLMLLLRRWSGFSSTWGKIQRSLKQRRASRCC